MKKAGMIITRFLLSLSLILTFLPAVGVYAADSYTITYRAGNVGTYDTTAWTSLLTGKGYQNFEVTDNYIKIKVKAGEAIPSYTSTVWTAYTKIAKAEKYFVLDPSKWGPADGTKATRNQEYVTDYGVLVDPVKYTIEFRDTDTGEEIATPIIGYGNDGEVISCTPLTITNYATTVPATTLTLTKGASNLMTFSYSSTYDPGTITKTVTTQEAGGTVTVTTPGDVVTNTVTVPGAATAGGAAGGAAGAGAGAAAGNTTINDQQTPLAGGDNNQGTTTESGNTGGKDNTTINDEKTPLAAATKANSFLIPIITGILVAVLIGAVVIWSVYKKRKSITVDSNDSDHLKK